MMEDTRTVGKESLPKENNVVLISSSSESERVFSYK
ncbi:unnamed protein product [Brassica rapa subsp. trilocularis]